MKIYSVFCFFLFLDTDSQPPVSESLPLVAFSAYASTHQNSLISGARLMFDTVLSNQGNAYYSSNSSFICPYTGLYAFFLNVYSNQDNYCGAAIVKDGEEITATYTGPLAHTVGGSNMAYVECGQGSEVYVLVVTTGGSDCASSQFYRTSFSGQFVGFTNGTLV